jgi:hypothetical protein
MQTTGRAQSVNVISPMRRWWSFWLRATWPLANRGHLVKRTAEQLSFIHVAHWSLHTRVPAHGERRLAARLPHPYLIFHSNFNDDLIAYLDAFALVMPWRMCGMWGRVYGFPSPRIVDDFVKFVTTRKTEAAHYYCAYPSGSARTIAAALELRDAHAQFHEQASALRDDEFKAAWEQFVSDNQLRL